MFAAGNLVLARAGFDVGLLTDRGPEMLAFWTGAMGFPVESTLEPVPGVVQHRLTMHGAVLKLNLVSPPLSRPSRLGGIRMLLLADPSIDETQHLRDPDGNLVCLVPPGVAGLRTFGVHLAVSDEQAHHRFYHEVLALPDIGHNAYDFAGATISFSWSPEVRPAARTTGPGYGYVTFQVMDTLKTHADLCARGATQLAAPGDTDITTTSSISFIIDPDGNRIEISQRPDLVATALRASQG